MSDLDLNLESAIIIWSYDHCPDVLKKYMKLAHLHNDDLDWIAVRPPVYENDYINWLEMPAFGCCKVEEHKLNEKGTTLVLGYHA